MDIKLRSEVKHDEFTEYIENTFDYKVDNVQEVSIPNKLHLNSMTNWNIGLVVGASGSGKSTILRSLGDIKEPIFDDNISLISNFKNMSPQDATRLLCGIGLASVPTWVRPYKNLSNGEQYRARLAKILADSSNDIILVDEYTSVVDRNVAMSMSNSLNKYIRRNNKRIILASCHYDIIDWLRPDWIYDLNKGGAVERCDYLRQRPTISLQVYRTTYDTWEIFKKYHYMTEEMNKAANCFVFTWDEKLVGFCSILPLTCGSVLNGWRESRIVVSPNYQGLGIGHKISEFIGGCLKSMNKRYFTKTVSPMLGIYRSNSKLWKATSHNGKYRNDTQSNRDKITKNAKARTSYCHEYVGEPIYGFEELFKPTSVMSYEYDNRLQLTLF